jgi:hypothetical protein
VRVVANDHRAYVVAEACILFNTVGALSAFLIVVGDLVRMPHHQPQYTRCAAHDAASAVAHVGGVTVAGEQGHTVLKEWLHDSEVPEFFYSKACVVLVFCFCVALPLSLFPNIHDLSVSSFLAVASVFVVAGTCSSAHRHRTTLTLTHTSALIIRNGDGARCGSVRGWQDGEWPATE